MTNTRNPIDVLVGQNVCRLRVDRGIDTAALAESLAVSEAALVSMEAGFLRVSAETLHRICQRLKVTPALLYELHGVTSL